MTLDYLGSAPSARSPERWSRHGRPTAEPRSLRRRRLAVSVSTVVVLGSIVAFDRIHEEPGPPSSQELEAKPPPTQEELNAEVEKLKAFVSETRGLEFLKPVPVTMLDEAEFNERLSGGGTADESPEDWVDLDTLYQALGILEQGASLADSFTGAMNSATQGAYSTKNKEIFLRKGELSPFVKRIIVHELVHALEDQHFGLHRPEYAERKDESEFAWHAVKDGSAEYVAEEWVTSIVAHLSDADANKLTGVGAAGISSSADPPPELPAVVEQMMHAPYKRGPTFVEVVLASEGQRALDAAFADPPRTSENILNANSYLLPEDFGGGVVDVAHPVADGEAVYDGVVGALFHELLFMDALNEEEKTNEQVGGVHADRPVSDAVNGWGGDQAVAWRDGERACVRINVVGDTPQDSDELNRAWSNWAESVEAEKGLDVTVDQSGAGSPVNVESCTG